MTWEDVTLTWIHFSGDLLYNIKTATRLTSTPTLPKPEFIDLRDGDLWNRFLSQ